MNHHTDMQSTGRGGAGNMGKGDGVVYTDGGVVREGPYGEAGHAGTEYTTGRGGAGNVHPDAAAASGGTAPREDTIVPETNIRESHQPDFHTGVGGQGNVHKEKYGGHSTKKEEAAAGKPREGLGSKIKSMLGLGSKK